MAIRNYFKTLFNVQIPQMEVRQQAYKEINQSIVSSFRLPDLQKFINSLSTKALLSKSIEMFVGSRFLPKNHGICFDLLKVAKQKAQSSKIKNEIQYYRTFFLRMNALKSGNQREFQITTQSLQNLAKQKEHPQSCYLIGKQLFTLFQNTQNTKQSNKIVKTATLFFQKSITDNQYGGLFYIGHFLRDKKLSNLSKSEVTELFIYGSAFGDPMSHFRLAQMYKKQGNIKLYIKYLKQAAEQGVAEAQHNLGCQYVEGKNLKKNEVLGLAWFMNAEAHGFIYSTFNVIDIFIRGSSCGKIKKNLYAALLKMNELKKSGGKIQQKVNQMLKDKQIQLLMQQE